MSSGVVRKFIAGIITASSRPLLSIHSSPRPRTRKSRAVIRSHPRPTNRPVGRIRSLRAVQLETRRELSLGVCHLSPSDVSFQGGPTCAARLCSRAQRPRQRECLSLGAQGEILKRHGSVPASTRTSIHRHLTHRAAPHGSLHRHLGGAFGSWHTNKDSSLIRSSI